MASFVGKIMKSLLLVSLALVLGTSDLRAENAYYEVPINDLRITDGELPKTQRSLNGRQWRRTQAIIPYAVLDGDGEVYLGSQVGRWNAGTSRRNGGDAAAEHNSLAVAVCAPKGQDVVGSLYVQNPDLSGLTRVRFVIPAAKATDVAKTNFYLTKEDHYRRLVSRGVPGSAWFRHQMLEAQRARTGPVEDESAGEADNREGRQASQQTQLEDTFQILSGGRAVSENLQLDRLLPTTEVTEPIVTLDSLPTISVREMDWKELTKDIDPQLDPTAKYLPADQHALLFPSFQALVTMVDEATFNGTPVLELVQPRSEDAQSRNRYERQLCLSLDVVSRALGDQAIRSVAVTGSDPYLRTGSDVAILFEAKNRDVLTAFVAAKRIAAAQAESGCEQVSGNVGELSYQGAVSPDRSICSYAAVLDDIVIVTNSLAQLRRIEDVRAGKTDALTSLPEYRFFRSRYERSDPDETALLIVTDATIRRWCGPKWRIATSRRTRAAAIMAEQQACHLDGLVKGTVQPDTIQTKLQVPDLGTLRLTKTGVTSSTYGSLDFLTPISELDFAKVTKAEADSYQRWREGYQRNWSQFFDPIAVRFSVRPERILADLTVMPLIANSRYRSLVEIASGASIEAEAGDRHAGALAHWALAINVESTVVRQAGNFLERTVQTVKGSPFGWMGQSIAVYVDEHPFWLELAKAENKENFFQQQYHRLPVALRAEVSSTFKLALFLSGIRAFAEQASPGLTVWETLEHKKQPYVKVSAAPGRNRNAFDRLAIYYAATPEALVVTINEDVLKNAIDRQVAAGQTVVSDKKGPDTAKTPPKTDQKPTDNKLKPWLGSSVAFQAGQAALNVFETIYREDYQTVMRERCWANIPILNEWKRRYSDREPRELHKRLWQTRLRCPGGGDYVWNPEWQTMESTVYGHPGNPKPGPASPEALRKATFFNFGLTFEHQGLRAKVAIERQTE